MTLFIRGLFIDARNREQYLKHFEKSASKRSQNAQKFLKDCTIQTGENSNSPWVNSNLSHKYLN